MPAVDAVPPGGAVGVRAIRPLTALEVAGGGVWGVEPTAAPLPRADDDCSPRVALERAVLPALLRPPCVVSFSGGRDSSAVLALAALVARREGLAPPVPVSLRFPRCEGADEDGWQELLIRHLRLPEWTRLRFDDELDAVGPYAAEVLTANGVLYPANVHFHLPVVEQASGGCVLTGFGGDELFDPGWVWRRINQVLVGRSRVRPRDVAAIAVAYGPSALRRAILRHRFGDVPPRPWLRPDAHRLLVERELDQIVAEPVRWDAGVDHDWWRLRYRLLIEDSLTRVGASRATEVRHPLTDGVVLSAIAREAGRAGYHSRTAAMRHLVGDLLPPDLTARRTKAVLTGVFWNRHARRFAAGWDGSGVDPEMVDVDVLRALWIDPRVAPDPRTFGLLQSAWLAAHTARGPSG